MTANSIFEWAFRLLIAIMVLVVIGIIIYVIPREVERSDNASVWATENGCKSLGHARDINSVYFFDCDGQIILKRFK